MDKKSIGYSFNLQRITIRKMYGLGGGGVGSRGMKIINFLLLTQHSSRAKRPAIANSTQHS